MRTKLPNRAFYRLSQAASILKCSVDDLLHWGGGGCIGICASPPLDMQWWAYGNIRGHDPNILTVEQFADPKPGDPTALVQLRGLFTLNPITSGILEIQGKCNWCDAIEGIFSINSNTHPENPGYSLVASSIHGTTSNMFSPAEHSDELIVIENLFITSSHVEMLKNGTWNDCADKNKTEKTSIFERNIIPHPTAERHAKNREEVLKFAIYCKNQWPEQCGKTYREWACLIDQKAALFWPKSSIPPLSTDQIERLLSKAHKLPSDVD